MTRRVEFADTDLAGIMHFANYFRIMEATEHAFIRSLGHSVHPPATDESELSGTGWPRVNVSCEYFVPVQFEEEIEVELLVEELGGKSIRYLFRFWKTGDGERRLAARGRMTAVCVRMDDASGVLKGIPIPGELRDKIEAAPPEALGDEKS